MRFAVSAHIDAEPEAVWAVLTDLQRWPQWTESVARVERLDDGPFAVGSTARVEQPRLRPMVWRVTEFDPGWSFTWTATSGGVITLGGHRLTPLPEGGARLDLSIHQSGLLAPLVGLLAGSTTRRYIVMKAAGLKRHCERR